MLQGGTPGSQLLYVRVTDGAVGSEEELSESRQTAGELLETAGAALQRGTPAQVQLLQHPDQPHETHENHGDPALNSVRR